MICPACFLETFDNGMCSACGFDENASQSPLLLPPGTALMNGQYLVGKLLGKPGGFGITYLGWDSQLATFVAVKEYLPRDVASRHFDRLTVSAHTIDDAEPFRYGLEQFLHEARTLAQFDHPNVVRVRSFFQENGTAYLVMDYLQGNSLQDYLLSVGGRMSEKAALDILFPILDGLREVHAKGFLHRDIKPQNIYITNTGRSILLDFGTARQSMGECNRGMTTIITPGYAPLEQYHRHGKQGAWTDIYACAATLYHLVTGIVPPEAAERVAQETLLSPLQLAPELSSQFSGAIMQALSIDPANRPQSVSAFHAALTKKNASVVPQSVSYPPPVPPPAWPAPPPSLVPPPGSDSSGKTQSTPPPPMGAPPYLGFPGAVLTPPQPRRWGRKVFLGVAAILVLLLGGAAMSYNSMNGYHTIAYNAGSYEGNLSWGTPSGKGKLTYADESVYLGDFSRGLRHGKGTLRSKSGDTYDGEWKNDKFDGSGKLALTTGLRYEGTFKDGKRNGNGAQFHPDGRQYNGAWVNDKANGLGVLTTKEGTKYTGPFKDDLPHGEGTFTTARKDQYVGGFENGQKSGQGTYNYANGQVYKGAYTNNKRNGQGTMKWSSGSQYVGEWKDDVRHGKGTQTLMSNGAPIAEYVGEYRNDIPYSSNGQYRLVLKKDGRVVVASYRDGSFYW